MRSKIKELFFRNTSVRQTVVKNTFWLGASIMLSRLIKAVLIIYVARVLGTGGYGIFSYAVSLASFFAIFSDVGVGSLLTREAAKDKDAIGRYFSTGLSIKFILLAISSGLIIFASPYFSNIPGAIPLLPLAAMLIIFDGIRDYGFSLIRAKEKMEVEAGINISTNIAITAFGLIAVFLSATPMALLAGYVLGSGVGMIISLITLRQYFFGSWDQFDKALIGPTIKQAWPFAVMGLLGTIMVNTDSIMLGWFLSADEVGLYSAALRPVQLLYFLPGIVGMSIFPALARFANKNAEKFRTLFESAISVSFLLAIPVFAGGVLLAKEIIGLLFGADYLPATLTFVVLLITLLTHAPAAFLINGIFAYNKQKFFIVSLLIGAIGNVILNLLFIPKFGIVGSAYATVIAQFFAHGSMWIVMRSINRFSVAPKLAKITIASVLMSVLVIVLNNLGVHVLINIALAGTIYFAFLYVLREPVVREFMLLAKKYRG